MDLCIASFDIFRRSQKFAKEMTAKRHSVITNAGVGIF